MIVFLAGMPRSGSTFSFNVVRELLARRGTVYQEAIDSIGPALAHAGGASHVLIKAHAADASTIERVKTGEIKAICTIRKPEDAIASWMEAFNPDLGETLALFRGWFALYERIREHALIVAYEEVDRNAMHAARAIAHYVCPGAPDTEISPIVTTHSKGAVFERVEKLPKDGPGIQDVGFSHYDTSTFYHRRHVSTLVSRSAHERIGDEVVGKIRADLAAFVDSDGNIRADF